MSLKDWADNRWLRPHKSYSEEIEGLFSIVDRDLRDATKREAAMTRLGFSGAFDPGPYPGSGGAR